MKISPRVRSSALALPFAFVLGCGGDGPTGPVNVLSAAAAADAFDALSAVTTLGFDTGVNLRFDPAVRAVPGGMPVASITIPVNDSEPCPLGGNTTVTGSFTFDENVFDGGADIRQNYSNCRAESSTGREWTFNGSPNIRTVMTFNSETFGGSGTMSGGFRYTSQGESGRCTISLTLTFTQTGGSVVGTACGQPMNETFDYDTPAVRL